MSYIPNCRPKYQKDATPVPYVKTEEIPEKEINPYYYGLLEGDDKEFLRGYDYNTVDVVNNLFDNLDVYVSEFQKIGLDAEKIDINLVDGSIGEVNKYYWCHNCSCFNIYYFAYYKYDLLLYETS